MHEVNQLVNYLNSMCLGNATIGMIGDSKLKILICQLATLKVNSTFVVLNDQDPLQRLQYIAQDARLDCLISCGKVNSSIQTDTLSNYVISIEDIPVTTAASVPPGYEASSGDEQPAYLLYTSGSTANQPKGVIQTQQNIVHQVEHYTRALNITSEDRLLQLATMSHDQAIVDIYGALLNGATLVLYEGAFDAKRILQTVQEQRISIFSSIPSVFEIVFKHQASTSFQSLRIVTIGGEETLLSQAKLFQELNTPDGCQLVNGYGATECSWVSSFSIDKISDLSGFTAFPLGKVTEGLDYLIDTEGYDKGGELLISGPGVSPGYWGNEAATEASFTLIEGKYYYRTGDIVLKDEHSEALHFMGRAAWHEKIRGNRINLREVETLLETKLSLSNCIVVAVGEGMNKILVAYVTPQEGSDDQLLKEKMKQLKDSMPDYMIPSQLIELPESDIPKLTNGKIDRQELKNRIVNKTAMLAAVALKESTEPETNEWMVSIERMWLEQLGIQTSRPRDKDLTFADLGGNSLKVVSLIHDVNTYCEKTLKVSLRLDSTAVLNASLLQFQRLVNWSLFNLKTEDPTQPLGVTIPLVAFGNLNDNGELIYYYANEHKALTINFSSLCVLADHYNKKYGISITPCESYDKFFETILNAIKLPLKPGENRQIGLTWPQNNVRDAHHTPFILTIDSKGIKLFCSDSINSEDRIQWDDGLLCEIERRKDKDSELADIEIVIDPYARQEDSVSCMVDAVCYLKNSLRTNVCAETKFERVGDRKYSVITEHTPESLKTVQKIELPTTVDRNKFFGPKNKRLVDHRKKYFAEVTLSGTTKSGEKDTKTVPHYLYLESKTVKFERIISEARKQKKKKDEAAGASELDSGLSPQK